MKRLFVLAIIASLSFLAGCDDEDGTTPPHGSKFATAVNAVSRNDPATLEKLLKEGVDLNTKTPDGSTLLYAAAGMGRPECVRVLLEAGADPDVLCHEETALHFVATSRAEEGLDIVRLLLAFGADPNIKNGLGYTPLDNALMGGWDESAELLKAAGAKSMADEPGAAEITKELCGANGVSIRRSLYSGDKSWSHSYTEEQGYTGEHVYLISILGFLCPEDIRIRDYDALPDGYFNVTIKYDGQNPPEDWKRITAAMENTFDVKIYKVKRTIETKVLRRRTGDAGGLAEAAPEEQSGWETSDTGYEFRARTMDQFVEFLGDVLEEPVIDETELSGAYDFTLDFDLFGEFSPETLAPGLEKLGLELVDVGREMEIIAIEPNTPAAPDDAADE